MPSRVVRKLANFRMLPEGWHYGEGNRISDKVINRTYKWYVQLLSLGFTNMDVFPGSDGEMLLTIYAKQFRPGYRIDHYIELLIEGDNVISLLHERDREEYRRVDAVTDNAISVHVNKIRDEIWNTSGSSMSNITTQLGASSKVALSNDPQKNAAAGFLSFSASASQPLGKLFASTPEYIIRP
jgi:hypothetical protein